MSFECKICEKNYKSYQSLWNHNKKFHSENGENPKIVDETTLIYKCKNCNKKFDKKQKKYYHMKKCKSIDISNNTVLCNIPITTINNDNKTITTNSNNINNGTINKTIIINNYNNDNLEYISEKFKDKLFKNLLDEEEYNIPLPKLIENIKFNPNHKENHNVKIKSDRSKVGFYYDENKWKAINKNELLDDLCNYSLKIFKQYFEEKKDKLSEDMISQYQEFSHIAKLKSDLRNQIKEKIENIAYIFTLNNENELDI